MNTFREVVIRVFMASAAIFVAAVATIAVAACVDIIHDIVIRW